MRNRRRDGGTEVREGRQIERKRLSSGGELKKKHDYARLRRGTVTLIARSLKRR